LEYYIIYRLTYYHLYFIEFNIDSLLKFAPDYLDSFLTINQLNHFSVKEKNMRKFFTCISLLFFIVIIGFATPSPSISASKDIAWDDRFIASDNGVVKDAETGLEWLPGPDRGTNWYGAIIWVENLTVAGGGWRMPTLKELSSLYKKGAGTRNMTPLLKTTGGWVWSGETKGSSWAWLFNFFNGKKRWAPRRYSKGGGLGFAVRSQR
jgi:hypothetical protein